MKKICITTFVDSVNYGALLQAYGLEYALRNLGVDVNFLNYRRAHKRTTGVKLLAFSFISNLLYLKSINKYRLRNDRFSAFKKGYLPLTKNIYKTESDILANPPDADIFITGSDQVWNLRNYDPIFFLRFAKRLNKKTAAYAPSMTQSGLNFKAEVLQNLKYDLNNIDVLSAREPDAAKLISDISGRECPVMIDPAFLPNGNNWREIAGSRIIQEDYICVYALHYRKSFFDEVKKLSKRINLPVYLIIGENKIIELFGDGMRLKVEIGPLQFLNLLANAKLACVNAFHGAVLSADLGIPFLFFNHTGNDTRTKNLLERISLKDVFVENNATVSVDPLSVDYQKAQSLINEERKRAILYLKNIISE